VSPASGLLLAVETATCVTSVALLRGDALLGELTIEGDRPQSERLLAAIDALLRTTGARIADVETYAVSIGPGSFTGLRVGLATVKGLAFAGACPVAAVPTLRGLAEVARGSGAPVAVLLDARREEVYAAVYPEPGEERVTTAEALAGSLPAGTLVVVGEGAEPAARDLAARLGPKLEMLPPLLGRARAARIGRVGLRMLERGEGVAPELLVPRYVRRAEAEVRRTGRRFEG
jgi:tRNA threonylcarbamoyladenosine biosynthesis protein TsaB